MRPVTVVRRLGYEIEQQESALAEAVEHARYGQHNATLTAMTSKASELFWRRGVDGDASLIQMKSSPRFAELTMQCPHCAHPDYICYGISRGVQRYRCQACWRILKSLRRGKDPALKQKYCHLCQEEMGCELQAEFSASIIRWSLDGSCKPPKHSHCIRSSNCWRCAMNGTCWRLARILSHTPSITCERPSPHKSNHWLADSGIA